MSAPGPGRVCAVDGCGKPVVSFNWCQRHYTRWRRHGDPNVTLRPPRELSMLDRFFWHVDVGDCWEWTGAKSVGYGTFGEAGRTFPAHLWLWRTLVGPVPDGLVLDHLCRNRACVNPDHLEPVTPEENLWRSPLVVRYLRERQQQREQRWAAERAVVEGVVAS